MESWVRGVTSVGVDIRTEAPVWVRGVSDSGVDINTDGQLNGLRLVAHTPREEDADLIMGVPAALRWCMETIEGLERRLADAIELGEHVEESGE